MTTSEALKLAEIRIINAFMSNKIQFGIGICLNACLKNDTQVCLFFIENNMHRKFRSPRVITIKVLKVLIRVDASGIRH